MFEFLFPLLVSDCGVMRKTVVRECTGITW